MKREHTILAWPAFSNKGANPYNALFYSSLIQFGWVTLEFSIGQAIRGGYSVFHLHWPDALLARRGPVRSALVLLKLALLLAVTKFHRAKVVWTMHNLQPHEAAAPWASSILYWMLGVAVDGVIYHSEYSYDRMKTRARAWDKCPSLVVPIGHYRGSCGPIRQMSEARKRFAIPDECIVWLFVGRVMPYKGVDELIAGFRRNQDPRLRLVVAGESRDAQYTADINALIEGDERIVFRPGFVADEELGWLLGLADGVALPYRQITNSSTAILALSYGVPVWAHPFPVFDEINKHADEVVCVTVSDWGVYAPAKVAVHSDRLGMAQRIERHFDWAEIGEAVSLWLRALR